MEKEKEQCDINCCNSTAAVTKKTPVALSAMCLKVINTLIENSVSIGAHVTPSSHPPMSPIHKSFQTYSQAANKSTFEELLLKTMKTSENKIVKKKKVKIASAELITHDDVIRKLEQKEQEKILKATKKKQTKTVTPSNTKNITKKKPLTLVKTSLLEAPKASTSKNVTSQCEKICILEDKALEPQERLSIKNIKRYFQTKTQTKLKKAKT